jgi:hypothetical protein
MQYVKKGYGVRHYDLPAPDNLCKGSMLYSKTKNKVLQYRPAYEGNSESFDVELLTKSGSGN